MLLTEVAKQPDEVLGVLVSARASLWLDKITRKLVERFNEDLPKPELVTRTEMTYGLDREAEAISILDALFFFFPFFCFVGEKQPLL